MRRNDTTAVRRRNVLTLLGGCAVLSGAVTGADATTPGQSNGDGNGEGARGEANDREEFPRVPEEDIPDDPVSDYATAIQFHPNQRRAAITTSRFGDGFEIYVVKRVTDPDSVADEVWQITDTDGVVGAMEWDRNNRIRYDEWFTRYERKLPPSHKIFEPTVVEELSFAGVNSL